MKISEKIYNLRAEYDLTQIEFGKIAGVSDKAVSTWEKGYKEPRMKAIQNICHYFDIPINLFVDEESDVYSNRTIEADDTPIYKNVFQKPPIYKAPRLGQIACGAPILAEEHIECYDDVPGNIQCDFTLLCKGDSMTGAGIEDGDIVYIRSQPEVENGEIAAVIVGDNEATLKRFKRVGDMALLIPENARYEPMIFSKEEMDSIRIIGKAVGFTRMFEQ